MDLWTTTEQSRVHHNQSRRAFLTISVSAALAGCAQATASKVQLPDWDVIKRNYTPSFSGPNFERLKRVGQRVLSIPTENGPWQFGVLESDQIIVLAFRGNGLVVATKVLELCENDGQLGALLAWVVMFPLPSTRISGPRKLTFEVTNATVIQRADLASVRALVYAGYDPRDALVVMQRIPVSDDTQPELDAQRQSAMESTLRSLGYQV